MLYGKTLSTLGENAQQAAETTDGESFSMLLHSHLFMSCRCRFWSKNKLFFALTVIEKSRVFWLTWVAVMVASDRCAKMRLGASVNAGAAF